MGETCSTYKETKIAIVIGNLGDADINGTIKLNCFYKNRI
jgi:hypothetical protein